MNITNYSLPQVQATHPESSEKVYVCKEDLDTKTYNAIIIELLRIIPNMVSPGNRIDWKNVPAHIKKTLGIDCSEGFLTKTYQLYSSIQKIAEETLKTIDKHRQNWKLVASEVQKLTSKTIYISADALKIWYNIREKLPATSTNTQTSLDTITNTIPQSEISFEECNKVPSSSEKVYVCKENLDTKTYNAIIIELLRIIPNMVLPGNRIDWKNVHAHIKKTLGIDCSEGFLKKTYKLYSSIQKIAEETLKTIDKHRQNWKLVASEVQKLPSRTIYIPAYALKIWYNIREKLPATSTNTQTSLDTITNTIPQSEISFEECNKVPSPELHIEPQNIITDTSSHENKVYSAMHLLDEFDTSWMTEGNSELSPINTEQTIESEIESNVTSTSETIASLEQTDNSYLNIASIPSAIIYTLETPPITTSQDSETPPLASDSISQSPERPKKRAKQTTPFSEEIIKHLIILIEHQLKTFGSISWTMVATHINRDLKPKIPINKDQICYWYKKKYLPSLHSKE